MKIINKIMMVSLPVFCLVMMTGCAVGAATAGYALKAQSADSLTADAELEL